MTRLFAFEKSVGGVLYRMENGTPLFLVLHYPHGHWDFPKGHVEQGEQELDTLKREIQEETGITHVIMQEKFRTVMRYYYVAKGNERMERLRDKRGVRVFKKVVYYIVETSETTVVLSHEHRGFAWLTYEAALQRLSFPKAKQILSRAHALLQK